MAQSTNGIRSVISRGGRAAVGTVAVSLSLLGLAAGTASADDLTPDPGAPTSGPAVEDGVRASGYQDRSATVGTVKESGKAVPIDSYPGQVIAQSPEPGNLAEGLPNCLFNFAGCLPSELG